MSTNAPTYVYRVVVERWPDWCPNGWDRIYSDDDIPGTTPVPEQLREILDQSEVLWDMSKTRNDFVEGDWHHVALPRRDRNHWLSGAAAHRWVRHARALGAIAHVERASCGEWVAQ